MLNVLFYVFSLACASSGTCSWVELDLGDLMVCVSVLDVMQRFYLASGERLGKLHSLFIYYERA